MKGARAVVLEHLKTHGSITSMEAINKYGVTRLAAIIHVFRKLDLDIETKMLVGKNRFGEACQYAEYIYKGVNNGN